MAFQTLPDVTSLGAEPSHIRFSGARKERTGSGRGGRGDLHDLCNMLQVAMAALQILESPRRNSVKPDVASILPGATDALRHACVLARRLLDRPESGDQTTALVEVDATIERSAAWGRAVAPSGVRIQVESPGNIGAIRCLQSTFENALNLVINAIDATGGSGTVRIGAIRAQENDEPVLRVFVEDDGVRIDEEIRDKLFTVGASGKRGGSGLGLAGVAEFAQSVGGDVIVSSSKGVGTHVTLLLPVDQMEGTA